MKPYREERKDWVLLGTASWRFVGAVVSPVVAGLVTAKLINSHFGPILIGGAVGLVTYLAVRGIEYLHKWAWLAPPALDALRRSEIEVLQFQLSAKDDAAGIADANARAELSNRIIDFQRQVEELAEAANARRSELEEHELHRSVIDKLTARWENETHAAQRADRMVPDDSYYDQRIPLMGHKFTVAQWRKNEEAFRPARSIQV